VPEVEVGFSVVIGWAIGLGGLSRTAVAFISCVSLVGLVILAVSSFPDSLKSAAQIGLADIPMDTSKLQSWFCLFHI